ncbi:AAA family ATPase [Gemella sp.]
MAYFLVGNDNSSFFSKRTTWDLEAAINASKQGDVIEIQAGYVFQGTNLLIDKDISIIGKVSSDDLNEFPEIRNSIIVRNCNVVLNNIIINICEESNALNIKENSKVITSNFIVENQLTDGEVYPLCYLEDSELILENSVFISKVSVSSHHSTFKALESHINGSVISDNSTITIDSSEIKTEIGPCLEIVNSSVFKVNKSNLLCENVLEHQVFVSKDSEGVLSGTSISFLNDDNEYHCALGLINTNIELDSVNVDTLHSIKSNLFLKSRLFVNQTASVGGNSRVYGNELVIAGKYNGDVNFFVNKKSCIELKTIAIGVESEPDIKIERGVSFDVKNILSLRVDEEDNLIVDENNSLLIDEREIQIKYFGEKTANEKLEEMIGLDNLKNEVKEFIAISKMNKIRKDQGYNVSGFTLHSLFLGNPGTGKTTVARLMGKLLYENQIISADKYVETSRSDLVGQYIGHTAQKTREVLESALGGVLFIDEAYTLATGGDNDFGIEAINEILKFMEDHRQDLVIIFAGYTKDMERFLEMNEGLRSRIPNTFTFEDYTVEQLVKIGFDELTANGYKVEYNLYKDLIENNLEKSNDHSNGRWVRNQNEKILRKLAVFMFDKGTEDLNNIPDVVIKQCYL